MAEQRWNAMIAKKTNDKTYWTQVGSMWENKAGTGFNLVLDAIPAPSEGAYRISLFEPKENNNSNSGAGNSNSRGNNSGNSGGGSYSNGRPGANRNQSDDNDDSIPF